MGFINIFRNFVNCVYYKVCHKIFRQTVSKIKNDRVSMESNEQICSSSKLFFIFFGLTYVFRSKFHNTKGKRKFHHETLAAASQQTQQS